MEALKRRMTQDQLSLIAAGPELPEGFRYRPEITSADDERGLLERNRELPLKEFEFHGFTAKRRVISYGWKYDFEERAVRQAKDIPPWLLPLREIAAGFAASRRSSCSRRW